MNGLTRRTHVLKTDPEVFDAVASGQKTFEIRWNDRGYQVGDVLFLRKTRYTGAQMIDGLPLEYVGEPIRATVTYALHGPLYGLAHGWVIMGISAAAPRAVAEMYQDRVNDWMHKCFGPDISADAVERNHRFLEESLELVQSLGCSRSEAHQLVDYVFNRPDGEPRQEVGGVRVTLAALCNAAGIDEDQAAEVELQRVSTPEMIEKIRAKQAAKPKHSPLPQQPVLCPAADGAVLSAQDIEAVLQWYDALNTMDRGGYLDEKDRAVYEKIKGGVL